MLVRLHGNSFPDRSRGQNLTADFLILWPWPSSGPFFQKDPWALGAGVRLILYPLGPGPGLCILTSYNCLWSLLQREVSMMCHENHAYCWTLGRDLLWPWIWLNVPSCLFSQAWDYGCALPCLVLYNARDQMQGFVNAKQALHQMRHMPNLGRWFFYPTLMLSPQFKPPKLKEVQS